VVWFTVAVVEPVSPVAGMVARADSIDDLALLRHGGMGRLFAHAYAPSTLGSFLRAYVMGAAFLLACCCHGHQIR
jgi:hypothetical protein